MCMRRCAANITAAASSCRPRLKGAACSISARARAATSISSRSWSGREGEVVGVDMTDEQLATANDHVDWHMRRFGYARRNVRFLKGYIEKLDELGLAAAELRRDRVELRDQSLGRQAGGVARRLRSAQAGRRALFRRCLLRPAAPRSACRADPVLYGECLGGALYWNDFLPMAKQAGFLDPRLVTSRPIDDRPTRRCGRSSARRSSSRRPIGCSSSTGSRPLARITARRSSIRARVPEQPDAFELDGHHLIERGKVFTVCGNTWRMLADTRFAPHFDFIGDFSTHYGIFPGCGTSHPVRDHAAPATKSSGGCC